MEILLVIARLLFHWLLDQRSVVAGSLAIALYAVTLVLRFGFNIWWPWGLAMATGLALVAVLGAVRE